HAFVSNDAAHTDLYTLSLHDALPISGSASPRSCWRRIWEMSVEARWRMSYRTGRLLRCTEMSLVLALCLAAAPAPGQGANWSRVVAALQLVAEEYSEALELHDRDAARRRQLELAELLERVAALVPAPDIRAGVESIRTRSLGVDYKLGGDCRALVQQVLEHAPIRRTPHAKPDLAKGKKLYAD